MAEWGHQNKEGTSPLSPSVEGPMASRAPFTDTFFASEDPLCLSPEDNLRPPAKETLSVSPCEGENLVPEVGETWALASLPASKTLSVSPCEGEDLVPEVGETRALVSFLAAQGFCDSPIG